LTELSAVPSLFVIASVVSGQLASSVFCGLWELPSSWAITATLVPFMPVDLLPD
jgi:hypothetical protein